MRSMTGYGRASARLDGRELTVELKSVNHRYLDLSFRLPRVLSFTEPLLRSLLSGSLRRGHIDVVISYQNHRQDAKAVEADALLALSYLEAAKDIARASELEQSLSAGGMLQLPDVIRVKEAEEDEQALQALITQAMEAALRELVAAREQEGAAIQGDLQAYLDSLRQMYEHMKALAPEQPENFRRKLTERVSQMAIEGIEPQRLAQEVALFADKTAVDEELARLSSHIDQMDSLLVSDEPNGRRMEFLAQEMNREINTIGSKTSELAITRLVLDAKNALEKMREQIQNAE